MKVYLHSTIEIITLQHTLTHSRHASDGHGFPPVFQIERLIDRDME